MNTAVIATINWAPPLQTMAFRTFFASLIAKNLINDWGFPKYAIPMNPQNTILLKRTNPGEDYFSKQFEIPGDLHSSAYGKAILAYLPEDQVERVTEDYDLSARTENTITTTEELLEELERVRERGFSLNDGEEIRGMRAVGAPIQKRDGSVLGAVSVSKPASRMREEEFRETIPEIVMSTANVIEVNIETSRNVVDRS